MRLMFLIVLLVAAAFIGVYVWTHQVWYATFTAGFIACAYTGIMLAGWVRTFAGRKKWIFGAILLVGLTGIVTHAIVMYQMTTWQARCLGTISRVINHGVAQDALYRRALQALTAYSQQKQPPQMTIGQIFHLQHPSVSAERPLIDSLEGSNGLRLFAASLSDTEVVMICQSGHVAGDDLSFVNFDGNRGRVQDRFRLTKRGGVREIQN